MSVFLSILKVLAAIPALIGTFDEFASWYVTLRISIMKKENADAIRKAVQAHDQRSIEKAYGDPQAGEPSGINGTIILDHPPDWLPKSQ